MKRGSPLEKEVKRLLFRYDQMGIPTMVYQPIRTHDGRYIGKHGYDFSVYHKGVLWAFDAKMCARPRWDLRNAKMHQQNELMKVKKHGGKGFFLVKFPDDLRIIDVEETMVDAKSLTVEAGIHTEIDFLGVLK